MSNKTKSEETKKEVSTEEQKNNLPMPVKSVVTEDGEEISLNVFDDVRDFVEVTEELLSAEMLESMKGFEIPAIMLGKSPRTIKGETKDFVELAIMSENGPRNYWAGQHKFVATFDAYGAGPILFTFLGLEKIKGSAKTVNSIKVSVLKKRK